VFGLEEKRKTSRARERQAQQDAGDTHHAMRRLGTHRYFFISFWAVKKIDDLKNKKLKIPFYVLLVFRIT
jgi:hypothetical protein